MNEPRLRFDRLFIGPCSIEPSTLTITGPSGSSTVEPKVMALLQVLAERPHTTAKREELLDRIWPDGDGSDESLTRLVYMLRKSFAETHGLRDIVKTVSKQGYLLVADVEREALSSSRASAKHLKANDADSSEFTYSLAVLPVSEVDETWSGCFEL